MMVQRKGENGEKNDANRKTTGWRTDERRKREFKKHTVIKRKIERNESIWKKGKLNKAKDGSQKMRDAMERERKKSTVRNHR